MVHPVAPTAYECSDFFYTLNGSEPCALTWEEVLSPAIHFIRYTWLLLFAAQILPFALLFSRHCLRRSRETSHFKLLAVISGFLSMVLCTMFYATGNLFWHSFDETIGILCYSGILFGSVLVFAAAGLIVLLMRQVFIASCGSELRSLRLEDASSYVPLIWFVVPYAVACCTVFALVCVGVIESPVVAIRVALGSSVIPLVIYAVLVTKYGGNLAKAMDKSVEMTNNSYMRTKSMHLKRQISFATSSSIFGTGFFGFVAASRVMHNPYFFVTAQCLTSVTIFGCATGVWTLLLFKAPKERIDKTSTRSLNETEV